LDLGQDIQTFLRGINAGGTLVVCVGAAFDVALFFEIREVARYAAFVNTDVARELILRHAGVAADGKNIAVVAGAKICFFELVRPINSFASAENIYFPHK
jgi:hypothetical protein